MTGLPSDYISFVTTLLKEIRKINVVAIMKLATFLVSFLIATVFISFVDSWRRRRRRRCYRNCRPENWAPWSACTKSCGSGTQVRKRSIAVPAICGGSCNVILGETRICNT